MSCHLVALNKSLGVCPIGICETVRRIIAKAVLSITCLDILEATGSLQLCAGHITGVEAAVHAVRSAFGRTSAEGVLLVALRMHSIPSIIVLFFRILDISVSYWLHSPLTVSQEGTTQGDPLAMPHYAIATLPLIKMLTS